MATEKDKTMSALKTAIQMEIDGQKYYLKASRESTSKLGSKLFQSLAAEEDLHRQKFIEIYEAIRDKKDWPKTDFKPDGGKALRTIFARDIEAGESATKGSASELGAVQTAMAMENKTYDYYREQGKAATYSVEKEFYGALTTQEREHYLVLLDYYEYLKDPAAWFVTKEHPSLDGG